MESWCTLCLFFKKSNTCNYIIELKFQMKQKTPIFMPTIQVKHKPKTQEISLFKLGYLTGLSSWIFPLFIQFISSYHTLRWYISYINLYTYT
jgi:hypothetical protein